MQALIMDLQSTARTFDDKAKASIGLFFKFAADSIARVRVCKVVCAFVGLSLQPTQLRVSVLYGTILNNTC